MNRVVMYLPVSSTGDVLGDIKRFASNGCNVGRIFLDHLDGRGNKPNPLCPFLTVTDSWNATAICGTPGYERLTLRDLTQKNPEHWSRLESILVTMRDNKMRPWFVFEDRSGETLTGPGRFLRPMYGNIQRYPGWNVPGFYPNGPDCIQPAIPGADLGVGLDDYRYAWELSVISLCYKLGIFDPWYEPKNEIGYDKEAATLEEQLDWIRRRCQAGKNLKYVKTIVSARPPITGQMVLALRNPNTQEPVVDLWDQHVIGEAADVAKHPNGWPVERVIWNTDGAANGAGPGESVYHYKDVSVEQIKGLSEKAVADKASGVCFMSQGQIDDFDGPFNMDKIPSEQIAAMSKADGWPPEPPPIEYVDVPVCDVSLLLPNTPYCPRVITKQFVKGQEPTKVCAVHGAVIEKTCYEKYIADRPWTKWQIGKYLLCKLGVK